MQGRVSVNGQPISGPALNLSDTDIVSVDGVPLPEKAPPRVWRYHKPAGVLTTARDPGGRPTIFDHLAGLPAHVMPIGRLDLNSEGLLLLSNSGDLARALELPAGGWSRRYRVRAYGTVPERMLSMLEKGVTIDGVAYRPIEAVIDPSSSGKNIWLTLTLREGRNREIRIVLAHFGLQVSRLIRTAYGPFQLGNLPRGGVASVPRKVLREQLGAVWCRFE